MKIKGLRINFLGDSITEGRGVTDRKRNRFDNIMKKKYHLKQVNNYGIGGTRFAYQTKPSDDPRYDLYFCGRAQKMTKDADIVVVYGGVNDYAHGDAPIGNPEDTTPATFYGAIEWIMNYLTTEFAHCKIVFLTPAHRTGAYSETGPSTRPMKRADALPLKGYADIIIEKAKKYCIPVLNMMEKLPINPNIPEHCEKYTTDGLHFNDEGHKVIAQTIGDFLLNL